MLQAPAKILRVPFWVVDWLKDSTNFRTFWLTKGYGSGGTYGAALWHLILCRINARSRFSWAVAPTFTQIADTLIPTFTEVLYDHFGMIEGEDYKLNISVFPKIVFHDGQEIWFKSGNRPSSLVGPTISHYTMTEPGLMHKLVYDKLFARLRCPRASRLQCLGEGTPEGMNDYETEANFPEGVNEEKNASRIILPTAANQHLPIGYLENLEKKLAYDPAKLKSYTQGIFVPFQKGSAYWTFNEVKNSKLNLKLESNAPILIAWDFNKSPIAWCIMQRQLVEMPLRRVFKWRVINESSGESRGLLDACAEIIHKLSPEIYRDTPIELDGDPNGLHGRILSTSSAFHQILQYLRRFYNSVRVVAASKPPSIQERLERVNALFAYELIEVAVWCRNLIRSLLTTKLKNGLWEIEKPSRDDWTHWSDAIGYPLFRLTKDDDLEQPLRPKIYGINK